MDEKKARYLKLRLDLEWLKGASCAMREVGTPDFDGNLHIADCVRHWAGGGDESKGPVFDAGDAYHELLDELTGVAEHRVEHYSKMFIDRVEEMKAWLLGLGDDALDASDRVFLVYAELLGKKDDGGSYSHFLSGKGWKSCVPSDVGSVAKDLDKLEAALARAWETGEDILAVS